MYSIDIDVGGTFTDGFFTNGVEVKTAKVLTTPHDVTDGFLECIRLGSRMFACELDEFLRRTAIARLSTTIGTNLLLQRKGSKTGLLVTSGFEETLYGNGRSRALGDLVAINMVAGIGEEVDDDGRIVRTPEPEAVLATIREMIHDGAQSIVVSLRNAWRNPANEHAVRKAVRDRYPVHYLRSVPVQLGVETVNDRDDHARTNSALLNAYIHAEMARILFRAEDKLREAGYERPLLVAHASGGSARIAKTIALNTLHSGPAMAVKGTAMLAGLLGIDHVVSGDMGGTSYDIGIVIDRHISRDREPKVETLRIATPSIAVESIAIGGGSIASVIDGQIRVGPQSAGSLPGPAAYGKGGAEATVTDANLVLGFIDPDYFLGGRMKLDVEAARRAIDRRVARRAGGTVESAALSIRRGATRRMAAEIVARLAARAQACETVSLFSVGGGGSLHACDIADEANLAGAVAFPFGSVFSAFGGSTTDVEHFYHHAFSAPASTSAMLAPALCDLLQQARRDMTGEGFALEDVALRIEAEFERESTEVEAGFDMEIAAIAGLLLERAGDRKIFALTVIAVSIVPHWTPAAVAPATSAAREKGRRPVYWDGTTATPTPIFERDALAPGHHIEGPAIVEGADTTYAVPARWNLAVHTTGCFILRRS
ncbi:MAG TPA: hydantoinase/oxoprolinase family protein [Candidatus Baltobacteraceae bacterium]|nr:hydantoinase/oxoprolinase family protein [Candidatus Baltobacteraceae bacterium]